MNDELTAKIEELRTQFETLQELVAMADVSAEMADTVTTIAGIPAKVQQIRDNGYVYANYLENKTEALDRQWGVVRDNVSEAIRAELERAQGEIDEIDALWDQLDAAIAASTGQ